MSRGGQGCKLFAAGWLVSLPSTPALLERSRLVPEVSAANLFERVISEHGLLKSVAPTAPQGSLLSCSSRLARNSMYHPILPGPVS